MKRKVFCTTDAVLRAAKRLKERDRQNINIKHPDVISTLSENRVREAFVNASKKLESITRP